MSTYSTTILADSPTLYLKLGETSGTSFTDSSGNSLTGTSTNSPTLNQTGGVTGEGGAVLFAAASSQDIHTSDSDLLSKGASGLSVEVWCYITTELNAVVVSKSAASNFEWTIDYDKDNHRFIGRIMTAAQADIQTVYSSGGKTTNTWYHVVHTWDGVTSHANHLYVNGSVDEGGGQTNTGGTYTNGTAGVQIARYGNGVQYFTGRIMEVAVYQSVLTSTQVTTHHNVGIGIVSVTVVATTGNETFAGVAPSVSAGSSTTQVATTGAVTYAGVAATITAVKNVTVTPPTGAETYAGIPVNLYPPAVMKDNPWVYYRFEEWIDYTASSNDTVLDWTGQGRFGSVVGSPVESTTVGATQDGYALTTDGVNDKFFIGLFGGGTNKPTNTNLGGTAGNWTFEFWWKATSGDSNIIDPGFNEIMDIAYTSGNLVFTIFDETSSGGSSSHVLTTSGQSFTNGTWYHIALTAAYNGSNSTMLAYVNAVQRGTATWSGSGKKPMILNGTHDMVIGYTTVNYYAVSIDELAIYAATLTSDQIGNHFNATLTPTDLTTIAPTGNETWAGVAATITAQHQVTVVVTEGNLTYAGIDPNTLINGGPAISVTTGHFTLAGVTPTIIANRFIVVDPVTTGSIQFQGIDCSVFPNFLPTVYGLVSDSYVGFTARDATLLGDLDFGTLSHGQTKYLRFRLANLSSSVVDFGISGASLNSDLLDMLSFSTDGHTYSSSVTISSVPANAITDVVYMKIVVAQFATIGEGTLLVDVEQTYA